MTLLDDLSGYEFEDAVASLFRAHGYDEVRVATRVADEGRDITMRDGDEAVVVECKHTATVSRPVVQKLHSAVATYDYDGRKRGTVVTSGRFTGPAEEYAERLRENGDPHPITLIDGADIRRLGEAVGMDMYNGRIEVLCEETLDVDDPAAVVRERFEAIENAPPRSAIDAPRVSVRLRPAIDVETRTQATFETGVGVIHRVDRRDHLVVEADRDGPRLAPADCAGLVGGETVPVAELETAYDAEAERFGDTEAAYREWVKTTLADRLATTVSYTGDNNVTYERECRPSPRDVDLRVVEPIYVPRVDAAVDLGEYTHRYVYDAGGSKHAGRVDDIRRCVHCDADGPYTYCDNCGSVNCETHTREERLTGDPVCTGCAVTDEFFFATKYFFDERNRDTFREEYEAMPLYRKPLENPKLVAAVGVVMVLLVVVALSLL